MPFSVRIEDFETDYIREHRFHAPQCEFFRFSSSNRLIHIYKWKLGQDSSGANQQRVLQHHPEVQPAPLSLRWCTNAAEETAQTAKGGIQLFLGTTEAKNHLSENLSREYLKCRQVFYHANTAFLEEGKAPAPSLPPSLTPPAHTCSQQGCIPPSAVAHLLSMTSMICPCFKSKSSCSRWDQKSI